IKGLMMLIVATFGLLANLISVIVLHDNKEGSLNVKAAYLHLMGDTLSSVAVIVGGIAIWKFHIYWVDPLITVLVGIYIIYHTWGVVKETVDILMQTTPSNINVQAIKQQVEKVSGVNNMHHLHIWKLDEKNIHLETHINLNENMDMVTMMKIKAEIEELLKRDFDISHITLQIGYECPDCTGQLIVKQENK
ncbi:MAG: cation diffusion facilitator family transporter, partial [Bacteroidaceae bacterium]